MGIKIYPYKAGSRSAGALAEALGGRVLRRERSTYRPRRGDLVINWGASDFFGDNYPSFLNGGGVCGVAADKLRSFQRFRQEGVSIPDFWTNREDIPDEAFPIVCRTILRGHSGNGIVISNTRRDIVPAPLYVRYVKKQDEYRVHIVRGAVVAVQRKAVRADTPRNEVNFQVRNHANGFVFAREGVNPPPQVIEQAQLAITALGLDFGGVDVIYNSRQARAYVLEVNTACGLEGQTVNDYATAFRAIAEGN